jgi:hypothetical protein
MREIDLMIELILAGFRRDAVRQRLELSYIASRL